MEISRSLMILAIPHFALMRSDVAKAKVDSQEEQPFDDALLLQIALRKKVFCKYRFAFSCIYAAYSANFSGTLPDSFTATVLRVSYYDA